MRPHADLRYDAGPTGCGELLVKLFIRFRKIRPGQIMEVVSYDTGTKEDLPSWCRMQGHRLIHMEEDAKQKIYRYWIQKG